MEYYTPFHLALNKGFIALNVGMRTRYSPDILDLRLQDSESKRANENQQKKRDPEELVVHISRAHLFTTSSHAIFGAGTPFVSAGVQTEVKRGVAT